MEEEHLDHEALAELKEVMEDDFQILLSAYLSDSEMRIRALQAALHRNDPDQYAKAAHSLKGSCINIGAMRLGTFCSQAEATGRAGKLNDAPANLSAIEAEFSIVSKQLSPYLES